MNAAGEARTQLAIECKPKRNIYLETQHEESWAKIQDLENKPDLRLKFEILKFWKLFIAGMSSQTVVCKTPIIQNCTPIGVQK